MPNDFASFNFAKRAKIREIAKFNLAKVNPIKVLALIGDHNTVYLLTEICSR